VAAVAGGDTIGAAAVTWLRVSSPTWRSNTNHGMERSHHICYLYIYVKNNIYIYTYTYVINIYIYTIKKID
jgi:hypothetical protein